MTDHELEQRLRTWYRVEVADEVAPESLYASLSEITADATDVDAFVVEPACSSRPRCCSRLPSLPSVRD